MYNMQQRLQVAKHAEATHENPYREELSVQHLRQKIHSQTELN